MEERWSKKEGEREENGKRKAERERERSCVYFKNESKKKKEKNMKRTKKENQMYCCNRSPQAPFLFPISFVFFISQLNRIQVSVFTPGYGLNPSGIMGEFT